MTESEEVDIHGYLSRLHDEENAYWEGSKKRNEEGTESYRLSAYVMTSCYA